ncbi:MAG: hypothetical protein HY901_10665 [Deltaproteobacteria bacterium]|nr:hypothetical protein [Deltaproteobacteria bacterium]
MGAPLHRACALLAVLTGAFPGAALAVPCPTTLPVLFIVQDKSGSMGEVPTPSCATCPTKWESSTTAVTNMTTRFANRFDFGLELFPAGSSSCSVGTVVAQVPSSPQVIHNHYSWESPVGATPTAASLTSAKDYLSSLHLQVPAHVLLITDGMPNCNYWLDRNTCVWSMGGCDPSSCAGSSCLDDAATEQAAAAVLAAGFKVFVVGFGANAVGSNQAVLNRVAQAGGTGQAYAATDEQSLSTALETIAAQVANCCVDVCTQGVQQCSPTGDQQRCQFDSAQGCTAWVTSACPPRSVCSNGACVACADQCATLDATRCNGDSAQRCIAGAGGCYAWSKIQDCGYGETCQNGACVSCTSCNLGDTRCLDAHSEQTCQWDPITGCTEWSQHLCDPGSACLTDTCARCDQTCSSGTRSCNGRAPTTCVVDGDGCTRWRQDADCSTFCSGGACGVCGTECTYGTVQCDGPRLASCGRDVNDCPIWSSQACPSGTTCSSGACVGCPPGCTPGTTVCAGMDVMECRQQASGCWSLAKASTCAAGEICTQGSCTRPCANECQLNDSKCSGEAPYACVTAPTGCTVWQAGAACVAPRRCAAGGCRDGCSGGEIETCAPGYVCSWLTGGSVCVPETTSADAGTAIVAPGLDGGGLVLPEDRPDAATGKPPSSHADPAAPAGGCGCASGAAPAAMTGLLPFLLLSLSRRRRALRS